MTANGKVYKISCYSDCGTYFQSYLQSVTVVADDVQQAIERVKDWLEKSDKQFIKSEKFWEVEELEPSGFVLDYVQDSDY